MLFSLFFLDSLLVTVSGFIGLFRSACYFNLSSLQISGSTGVYPCKFPRYEALKVSRNEDFILQPSNTTPGNGLRIVEAKADVKP